MRLISEFVFALFILGGVVLLAVAYPAIKEARRRRELNKREHFKELEESAEKFKHELEEYQEELDHLDDDKEKGN